MHQLDANSFEEIIYDNGEPCLVIFSRENCHVCQEVIPVLSELQPEYEGRFGFYYVDIEAEKNFSQRFSLRGVPSILFFNDGVLKGKLAGNIEGAEVEEKIAAALGI
ncbi:thioredoxin family protein [Anaerospora hongkongensis]|uniref:thioredoxin family protein n=1 Tax=Anaerospora hongkongensis TaxID=244830 RepID=UPI00289F576C|nr:thioredoxin family protein [Anaerospora hongkongensis]